MLRESPALVAPSGELAERGHCLVCLAALDTESCLLCEGCGFPLCDSCGEEDSPHLEDCHQLAAWAAASYSPLPPHRLLQLREAQPSLYQALLSLPLQPGRLSEPPDLEVVAGLQHQHGVAREEVVAGLAVLEDHGLPLSPGLTGLYFLTSLLARRQEPNCRLLPSHCQPHLLSLQATRRANNQQSRINQISRVASVLLIDH